MSGVKAGVQARILEKQSKAIYSHCAGHSLNLAILNSCSIHQSEIALTKSKLLLVGLKPQTKDHVLFKLL